MFATTFEFRVEGVVRILRYEYAGSLKQPNIDDIRLYRYGRKTATMSTRSSCRYNQTAYLKLKSVDLFHQLTFFPRIIVSNGTAVLSS